MTTVWAPLSGRAVRLTAVPDPVFSQGMVGPGVAVDPVRKPSAAVAPVDGVVVSLYPHAFVIVDQEHHAVLTHLGMDTVQLNGRGFEPLVGERESVRRGQPVLRWDPAGVEAEGRSPLSPVVVLAAPVDALRDVVENAEVETGDPLFRLHCTDLRCPRSTGAGACHE